MAEYRLTPAARQDFDDIFEHGVATWGLQTALGYADDLAAAFEVLADAPRRGASCETIRPGYRRFSVASHVIHYKTTSHGIAVIRVLHQRMHAPRHL